MANCYLHQNEDAVSSCTECGVDLCNECDILFEEQLCKECKKKELNKSIVFYLASTIISFLVTYSIVKNMNFNDHNVLVLTFCIFCGTFGLLNIKTTWIKFKNSKLIQNQWNFGKKMEANAKANGADQNGQLSATFSKLLGAILMSGFVAVGYGIVSYFTESKNFFQDIKDLKLAKA